MSNEGRIFTVDTNDGLEMVEYDKASALVRTLIDECERQKALADKYMRREALAIDSALVGAMKGQR